MDPVVALSPTVKLAEPSAAAWRRVRAEAFAGVTTVETANTLYRFIDGVFSGRASTPTDGREPTWEPPSPGDEMELIGFYTNEGGFWSFAPKWRAGSHAVIVTKGKTFTLTSATRACRIVRPLGPQRAAPERSDVFDIPRSRPLAVRRPAPPSMTRIQAMPALAR